MRILGFAIQFLVFRKVSRSSFWSWGYILRGHLRPVLIHAQNEQQCLIWFEIRWNAGRIEFWEQRDKCLNLFNWGRIEICWESWGKHPCRPSCRFWGSTWNWQSGRQKEGGEEWRPCWDDGLFVQRVVDLCVAKRGRLSNRQSKSFNPPLDPKDPSFGLRSTDHKNILQIVRIHQICVGVHQDLPHDPQHLQSDRPPRDPFSRGLPPICLSQLPWIPVPSDCTAGRPFSQNGQ